jgi:flagellar motor component MotA
MMEPCRKSSCPVRDRRRAAALCGILPIFGLICAILGIVFSALGMRRANETGNGKGLAIAGLVIGIAFTAIAFLFVLSRF